MSRRFIFILTYAKTQNVQVFRHKLIMTFSALNYYFCLCCSEKFPCQTDFAFTCPHINSTYFSSSKTKMHTNLTYKEMESSQPPTKITLLKMSRHWHIYDRCSVYSKRCLLFIYPREKCRFLSVCTLNIYSCICQSCIYVFV